MFSSNHNPIASSNISSPPSSASLSNLHYSSIIVLSSPGVHNRTDSGVDILRLFICR